MDYRYRGYNIISKDEYYEIEELNVTCVSVKEAIEYIDEYMMPDPIPENPKKKFMKDTKIHLADTGSKDVYIVTNSMGYITVKRIVDKYNAKNKTRIKVHYDVLKDGVYLYF